MTDYKKYSLENLENWLYDAMSCDDATPQEIYDTIIKVVKDEYYTYKKRASESYELLTLLNGNGGWSVEDVLKERDYYEGWDASSTPKKEDQVNRWVLPVELDGLSGECYVQLPDDLLDRAGLKEGDMVHWIPNGSDSYLMKKVINKDT